MSIDDTAMLLSGQMVRNKHGTFYFDQPGVWVDEDGWPKQEQLHRTDGPAVDYANVDRQEWYVNGRRHRSDGPAVIGAGGIQMWYLDGRRHRLDGPAVSWANGDQEWWVNGVRTK